MFKKTLIAAVALSSALCANAKFGIKDQEPGTLTLGATTGISGYNNSLFIGAEASCFVSPFIRITADADYAFQNHGVAAFMLNVNSHMPLGFDNVPALTLYPIGGLSAWTSLVDVNANRGDSADNENTFHIGLNLGVGAEYEFVPGVSAFAEYKEVIYSNTFDQTNIGLRLRF